MRLIPRFAALAKRLRHAEEGQALVEFALVVPFLLVFLIGIVEFGRAWNLHQVITDAAREGARKAVVHNSSITADSVRNTVKSAIASAGVDPDGHYLRISGDETWLLGTGEPAVVGIELDYQFIFFGALKKWTTGQSTVTLRTQFTMRNE